MKRRVVMIMLSAMMATLGMGTATVNAAEEAELGAWISMGTILDQEAADARVFVPAEILRGEVSKAGLTEWLQSKECEGEALYELLNQGIPSWSVEVAVEVEVTEGENEAEPELSFETKSMTLDELLADEGEVYLAVSDLLNEAFQSEVRSSTAQVGYQAADAEILAEAPRMMGSLYIQQDPGLVYYKDGVRAVDESQAIRASFNPGLYGIPVYSKPIEQMTDEELEAGKPVAMSWSDTGWNNTRQIGNWSDGAPMYDAMANQQPEIIEKYNEMYVIARGKEYSPNPKNVISVHNNVEKNSESAIGSPNPKNGTGGFLFAKYYLGLEDEPYDSYEFLSNYLYFGKLQNGNPNENPTYFADEDMERVEETVAKLDALVKSFADGEVVIAGDYDESYHDGAPQVTCTIREITGPIPVEVMNAAYWNCAEKDYSINHSDLIYDPVYNDNDRYCYWFDRVLSDDPEVMGKPPVVSEAQKTNETDWQISIEQVSESDTEVIYEIEWGQYLDSRFDGSELVLK